MSCWLTCRTLQLATSWNAVLLIDEADVFLEKRGTADLMRNSLVATFLRLLEYHSGMLFLTTNRVKAFDEAFLSRVSVGPSRKSFRFVLPMLTPS